MFPNVTQSFKLQRPELENCRAEAMLRLFIAEHCSTAGLHNTRPVGGMHGRNFVVKCGEDSLVRYQYSHRVDAEVTFYIYRFPILFLEVF